MGGATFSRQILASLRRHVDPRRANAVITRHLGRSMGTVIAYVIVAMLFFPPLAFLIAGIWGFVAYIGAFVAAWRLLTHWQLDAFFARLSTMDLAARIGLAGGAYFALVLALIVVFAGIIGRRARRWFLVPGLVLALPAASLFVFAAEATHAALATRLHLPSFLAPLLTFYALCDAVALAVLLLDTRPSTRRRRGSRPLRAAPTTRPIPRLEVVPPPILPASSPLATGAVGQTPAAFGDQPIAQPGVTPAEQDGPAISDGPAPGLTA